MKDNILVLTLGYFGRGSTVKEAATNCFKAGSPRSAKASVTIVDVNIQFVDGLTVAYPNGERPKFQTNFCVRTLGSLLV